MTNSVSRIAAFASSLGLASGVAFAGVVIQFENKTLGKDKPDQTGTIFIESDRLRMQGGAQNAIFRGDKQVLWTIEEKRGVYHEMTKEQMKAIGEQTASAMTQLQGNLDQLPPEQRKMVEQMMARKTGQAPAAAKKEDARTFVKTGKTETINGYPCVSYDAMRAGKREQELWVTDWKRFDLKAADFQVFQDFAAFVKEMMGPLAGRFTTGFDEKFSDHEAPDAIPGLPIRVITFGEGGDHVTEMKKIAKESIPPATFEVPAGLEKQSMMTMEHRKAN